MRHPKSRIHVHVQLRAESGLAALLFLRVRHPRVPEHGHRHVRATQVYDVQHGSRRILLAGRRQEMEGEASTTRVRF